MRHFWCVRSILIRAQTLSQALRRARDGVACAAAVALRPAQHADQENAQHADQANAQHADQEKTDGAADDADRVASQTQGDDDIVANRKMQEVDYFAASGAQVDLYKVNFTEEETCAQIRLVKVDFEED